MKTRIALVVLFTLAAARMASADTGVLLLARGGQLRVIEVGDRAQ